MASWLGNYDDSKYDGLTQLETTLIDFNPALTAFLVLKERR